MRISDWSSDVCSSDLRLEAMRKIGRGVEREPDGNWIITPDHLDKVEKFEARRLRDRPVTVETLSAVPLDKLPAVEARSEEHTSELQSLMRISYAVFCLKKKKK